MLLLKALDEDVKLQKLKLGTTASEMPEIQRIIKIKRAWQ